MEFWCKHDVICYWLRLNSRQRWRIVVLQSSREHVARNLKFYRCVKSVPWFFHLQLDKTLRKIRITFQDKKSFCVWSWRFTTFQGMGGFEVYTSASHFQVLKCMIQIGCAPILAGMQKPLDHGTLGKQPIKAFGHQESLQTRCTDHCKLLNNGIYGGNGQPWYLHLLKSLEPFRYQGSDIDVRCPNTNTNMEKKRHSFSWQNWATTGAWSRKFVPLPCHITQAKKPVLFRECRNFQTAASPLPKQS